MSKDAQNLLGRALDAGDVSAVDAAILAHPELLNCPSSRPVVTMARSVDMAGHILALGADIDAVGRWWAPGFGLRRVDQAVAGFLVERGANLTVHAAAGLGLVDHLTRMLDADPSLVYAKGGDGCNPLH